LEGAVKEGSQETQDPENPEEEATGYGGERVGLAEIWPSRSVSYADSLWWADDASLDSGQ
jgi:hypothetical protein